MSVPAADGPVAVTIAVLTFNRRETLVELLTALGTGVRRRDAEVIVVDNGSSDGTPQMLRKEFPAVRLIALPRNVGIAGRNAGIANARGDVVVTIDDDILGVDDVALEKVEGCFARNPRLVAVCFQVRDHYAGGICNWCHPYDPEQRAAEELPTTEISEGAVAFRRRALLDAGMYPDSFFISHEGADLCARLLDRGGEVIYTPRVRVTHKYATGGRPSWRRYYYDTRNTFWVVVRNYRPWYGLRLLIRQVGAMLVYAVRDGYVRYWLKAVLVACAELPRMLAQRRPMSRETERRIREINANRPGLRRSLSRRLFTRRVRL